MGIPEHFSLELPQRCLQLIDDLMPEAKKTFVPGSEELGPLTTTLLLALAAPTINLPYERIFQHIGSDGDGYADDRQINSELTKSVHETFQRLQFHQTPFYEDGAWSFVSRPADPGFNVAEGLPSDLCAELSNPDAQISARRMPTSQWISCLRNALAHGGVAYLNEQGTVCYGEPVKMFAFVSGKYDAVLNDNGQTTRKLSRLNILRINEEDFLLFLRKWVGWLETSGLATELAA